ncbi:MAG: hypothetical protein K2N81_03625 [Acetatifactor sp.]|nr:hypothetical protein [Acetatifactor sp.]
MKLQKVMAGTLAMALVLTANGMPVSAAQANKTGNLTVEGDTTYVDTTIYKVTLPTSSSLNFTLDPEGLVGFFADSANASATTAENADLSSYKGKIVGSGTETIVNESSVPIQLTCKYYLTNADGITVKTAKDSDWDATQKMLLLEAVAAKKSVADATDYAPTAIDTPAVDASTSVVAISSVDSAEPSTIAFALAAAPYEFKKADDGSFTYVPKDGATLDDTQHAVLSLAGFVSSDADWAALAEAQAGSKLTLNCVYSIKGLSQIDTGAANAENVVIDASKLTVANDGLKNGDTITSYIGDTDISFQVKMPEDATDISAIAWVAKGKTYKMPFTADGNEVIANTGDATVKYMLSSAPGIYPLTIAFAGSTTKYTLNWVIAERPALLTNGDNLYSVYGDTSLSFDLDLPAGATGVTASWTYKSKTYNMPVTLTGNKVTVDTSDTFVTFMLSGANGTSGTHPLKLTFAGCAETYTLNWVIAES